MKYNWIKVIERIADNPAMHQYLLAYESDYGLVVTSLYLHGKSFWKLAVQVASLDLAIWFHRSFLMDEWLL